MKQWLEPANISLESHPSLILRVASKSGNTSRSVLCERRGAPSALCTPCSLSCLFARHILRAARASRHHSVPWRQLAHSANALRASSVAEPPVPRISNRGHLHSTSTQGCCVGRPRTSLDCATAGQHKTAQHAPNHSLIALLELGRGTIRFIVAVWPIGV